jgi:hypothetical protein
MEKMKKFLVLCVFSMLVPVLSFASPKQSVDNITDSIKISLITCSPGSEIYNLFGHTAIRYHNISKNTDVVFNYGMFDFRKPNFMLRFTLGQTDYELGVESYQDFVDNYAFNNRSVEEQVLNLSPSEKQKLYELLLVNYMPEHRTYRYNFFYDNCSTRPRDKIEESIDGKVSYPTYSEEKSYRDLIHQYTAGHPWSQFGIDLLIGAGADKPISERKMMYIPFYLRDFVEKASIVTSAGQRPLVLEHNLLVISQSTEQKGFSLTPFQCALLLFAVTLGVTLYGIKKKKSMWIYDVCLYAVAGIAGCIIAFLMLFSTHPTVGSNFLILELHPFYLFCLPWIIIAERTGRKSRPAQIILAVLTLFMLTYAFLPQNFGITIVVLAFSLWVRLSSHVLRTIKKKK